MREGWKEVTCVYCGWKVPEPEDLNEKPPAVDNDEWWGILGIMHHPECEWIATRAHRRDDPRAGEKHEQVSD